MANARCKDIYRITFNAYRAQAFSVEDSASAAQGALDSCLGRAAPSTPVSTIVTSVPGSRILDPGAIGKGGNTQLGQGMSGGDSGSKSGKSGKLY